MGACVAGERRQSLPQLLNPRIATLNDRGAREPVAGDHLPEVLVEGQNLILAELVGVSVVGISEVDEGEASCGEFAHVEVVNQVGIEHVARRRGVWPTLG